jgi:hypothetical protein
MFATLSIRTKITVVVAFLLVAMAGMGILAVRSMQALHTNAVDIQSNWLPNVRVLGELQKNIIQYRSITRAYLLADTALGKEAVSKRFDGSTPESATATRSKSGRRTNAHFSMNGRSCGPSPRKTQKKSWRCPGRRWVGSPMKRWN